MKRIISDPIILFMSLAVVYLLGMIGIGFLYLSSYFSHPQKADKI